MSYPFEASLDELQADIDAHVDRIFADLTSDFLVMPRGPGFIDYPIFQDAYEVLKAETGGFTKLTAEACAAAVAASPVAFIVLRSILGFTPSEWAYAAEERTGVQVTQGFARTLDRRVRLDPRKPLRAEGNTLSGRRLRALLEVACTLIAEGAPEVDPTQLHRLDKADTKGGAAGVRTLGQLGVPYAMLLYERFLGRPFAGHRDSVSELVGNVLEAAIEEALATASVSFRKTKRAAKVPGFDQAPDFMVPDEYSPRVVIEAKLTEDDGTARDKVTRVQHLAQLSAEGAANGRYRFEVIACIAGRGFRVRREDMKKLLLATRGKVFTPATLGRMVESTRLKEFRPKSR
ncbi:hypothetical protein JXA88_11060 [Candidatus Fermentibacteria bacterium]|nr:hypothetical protein [Candidatus Fermentibacteria bacterium]